MNIYAQDDYREILRHVFVTKKKTEDDLTYDNIAKICKVQKTFISRVLNKQAHFNRDQLFALNHFFGFDPETREYLFALLDHCRSEDETHQKFLWQRITEIRESKKDTRNHIGAHKIETTGEDSRLRAYYLEPLCQIVHIALSIAKYQEAPEQLGNDLRVTPAKMSAIFKLLSEMELIKIEGGKIRLLESDIYIARDSDYYTSWRSLIRSLTATRLQELSDKEAYSFSVTFTASDAVKEEIQNKFMHFLKEIRPLVAAAPCEHAYQMNFDLFSWLS